MSSRLRRLAFGFITILAFSKLAVAQSTQTYFPYLANDAQTVTDVILTNVTLQDTTVTIKSFSQDGSSARQVSVALAAGTQTIITPEVGFHGWAVATASTVFNGHLRVNSAARNAQDTVEPARLGVSLIFPLVAQSSGANTEIAIANPSGSNARVALTIYDKDGRVVANADVALPGNGMVHGSIAALFGVEKNYSTASHVVARFFPGSILSPVDEISGIGLEIVRGFTQTDASSERITARGDWAAIPAIPVAEAVGSATFPHVNRGEWFSLFSIVNATDAAQTVTLTYSTAANPNAATRTISLPGNGAVRVTATDLFGAGRDSGFVKLSATGKVAVSMSTGTSAGSTFAASLASSSQSEFIFPVFDQTSGALNGVVLLNDGTSTTLIELFVMSARNETVSSLRDTIAPGQRLVRDLADLIPQTSTKGSYVFVRSTVPVFGLSVVGLADRSLSQIPGAATLPGFVPPQLQAGQQPPPSVIPTNFPVIAGLTVVTTGAGTAGNNPNAYAVFGTSEVQLRIDGANFAGPKAGAPGQSVFFGTRAIPSDNVIFADSTTIYVRLVLDSQEILAELAPNGFYGKYDITIALPPPLQTVRSNALPFYIVPPVPILTRVEPTQAIARYEVDSPGERLSVFGAGFREGSRLVFGNVEVGTKFKSSTELQVDLPPQVLRTGGIYTLRVRNISQLPEVSGEAVTFQVNNLAPRITSLTPPGPFTIIGPGTTPVGLDLAINGNNFFTQTTAAISLREPDVAPALLPIDGSNQCVFVNGPKTLRVRLYNAEGLPVAGVPVTFTSPGINTNVASAAFRAGENVDTIIVLTDASGFAPPLIDLKNTLYANSFPGTYAVTAVGQVNGITLTAVFNMQNINFGDTCVSGNTPTVTLLSSGQLHVSKFPIASRGIYSVVVANPAPGGGVSNEAYFSVQTGPTNTPPIIRAPEPLLPASRPAGSGSFNLTVFRENTSIAFEPGAWVNFGTVRLDRIGGDGQSITVTVPGFLITSPGLVPITVTNPSGLDNIGGTSNRVYFKVD